MCDFDCTDPRCAPVLAAAEERARGRRIRVVCADPVFGGRIRRMRGGRYADRIRIVLADDADAVARLDPAEPVLLTRAAHERLQRSGLRMIVPFSPWMSPRSAQALARLLVRLNRETLAGRGVLADGNVRLEWS